MSWSASVLTTISADTEPCVILTFDKAKYLFNAGENTGRSFLQSKRNWRKTKGVFFTDVGTHRAGGLPGLLMTFADATITELNVHGPTGILHYMASMRLYTYRDQISVTPNEIPVTQTTAPQQVFKDDTITVYALPVIPLSMAQAAPEPSSIASSPPSKKRKHEAIAPLEERMDTNGLTPAQLTGDMAQEWRRILINNMFPAPKKDKKLALKPPKAKKAKQAPAPVHATDATPPEGDHFTRRRTRPHPGFYSQLPTFSSSSHPPRDADPTLTPVLSYVVFGPKTRGQFDSKKATAFKIPNSGIRSALAKGETITFPVTEDGKTFQRTVRPEEIIAPPEPSHVVLILEIPSPAHIPSLIQSFDESPFYRSLHNAPSPEHNVQCVFHTCGSGVLEDPRYLSFMSKFHDGCHHVIASREHCPDPVTFTSAAFQQLRMQSLDSEIFALPKYSLTPERDFASIPGLPKNAELMKASSTIQIRPPTGIFQDSITDKFHPAVQGTVDLLPHTLKAFEDARKEVRVQEGILEASGVKLPGADVGVIPLGTGSAIPSKYRNVSSTLIRIPGYGNILLDAGEGTWGQLARMYGTNKEDVNNVWNVLRQTRCIFASHIHGDHHMGLAQILRMRRTLSPPPTSPLYLVALRSVHLYLRELSDVQNIGLSDGVVQIMSEALHWKNPEAYPEYGVWRVSGQEEWTNINVSKAHAQALCESLNLAAFRTVDVRHRTVCYGLHIKSKDGWSIVFSADTIPADPLVYAGQGCTLLIHEATMADDQEEMAAAKSHSTHGQAVKIGKRMNAKVILLNHFSARYPKLPSEAKGGINTETTVVHAFDHANLTIGNMWKLEYYLNAVVKSLKDTEDEEDEMEDDMVLINAAMEG